MFQCQVSESNLRHFYFLKKRGDIIPIVAKKIKKSDLIEDDDDMLPEYDFTGMTPVRGKYYRDMRKGYIVRIHNEDGTITEKHYGPTVTLDLDVAAYFPDSESVNNALRTLIALVPQKQIGEKKVKYSAKKKSSKKNTAVSK